MRNLYSTGRSQMAVIYGLWLVAFLGMVPVRAQQALVDSFLQASLSAKDPLDKIDYALGISRAFMFMRQRVNALKYANQALKIARTSNLKAAEANALCFVAMLDEIEGDKHYETSGRALEVAHQSKNPDAIAFATYLHVEMTQFDAKHGKAVLEDLIETYDGQLSIKNHGNVLKVLAWQYERLGELDLAEETYYKAAKLFRKLQDSLPIVPALGRPSTQTADLGLNNLMQCHTYLSELYLKKGDYAAAIQSCETALALGRRISDSESGFVLGRLAKVYAVAGQIPEAIEAYSSAADIHDKLGDQITRSVFLLGIGDLYKQVGDYPTAIKFYEQSYQLNGQMHQVAPILLALGDLHEIEGKYPLAFQYYQRADSIYSILGDSMRLINSQLHMAGVLAKMDNHQQALHRIDALMPQIESANDLSLLHRAFYASANINHLIKNNDEALHFAKRSLEAANNYAIDKKLIKQSYGLLYQIQATQGYFAEALQSFEQYHNYHDSINSQNAQILLKQEQVRQNVAEYKAQKDQADQQTVLLRQRNKLYVWVAILLAALLGLTFYFMARLRKTQHQISEQNKSLLDLNKTKDRFFGLIAHDIKSPIISLESVEEQMRFYAKKGKSDKVISIASQVTKTAEHLNNLLSNLLDWARIQTGQIPYLPIKLDLKQIVAETIELYQANADIKGIQIESHFEDMLPIYADENAIRTILRNLLSNAIKFSHNGGAIIIRGFRLNDMIALEVLDQGIGLSQKEALNIFSLETQSKMGTAGESGSGLGLLLCRDLIRQNKGSIRIKNTSEDGTIFEMLIPMAV